MAAHSSVLAWKIPRTEEPDRLHSLGRQRLGHDWATSLSLADVCLKQKYIWQNQYNIVKFKNKIKKKIKALQKNKKIKTFHVCLVENHSSVGLTTYLLMVFFYWFLGLDLTNYFYWNPFWWKHFRDNSTWFVCPLTYSPCGQRKRMLYLVWPGLPIFGTKRCGPPHPQCELSKLHLWDEEGLSSESGILRKESDELWNKQTEEMPKHTGGGDWASMPSPGIMSSHGSYMCSLVWKLPEPLSSGFYGDLIM